MFAPVDPKQSFPKLEEHILTFWKKYDVFQKSIDQRDLEKSYTFYDGPPFATGLPHYGHILAGTMKDVVPRYFAMKGYHIERRFGWDCHGLPVENEVEKMLDIKSKKDILDMGIDVFNEKCRSIVQKHVTEWRQTVDRMGRWVDFVNDYKTMDPSFMETIWWVFKSLWDQDLIYEGHKSMHICPRCETALSNFEVTQGYQDLVDETITAKFKLLDEENTYALAWTTTPWTLPGNTGLAFGADIDYVKVKHNDEILIVARELFEAHFPKKDGEATGEIVSEHKGSEFVGKKYEPLFDYYVGSDTENIDDSYRVITADFVSTEDGTGIVHIAPSFGEDDMKAGKEHGLAAIQHIGMDGRFREEVKDFVGKGAKESDPKIIAFLKEQGKVFASKQYKHSYPHCWRCDSPLLNYSTRSWFVKVEHIKKKMLAANEQIHWMPEHLKHGRFGKWLENARDWAISRDRFWGTPLPIWRCEESGHTECIGSMEDLFQKVPEQITKIIFVRHGESEGNVNGRRQGQVPGTKLTEAGKKQAAACAKELQENHSVDLIIASPLDRTQETASYIQEATGAEITTADEIREIDFGVNEGKTDSELSEYMQSRSEMSLEERYSSPLTEGAESHADVSERSLAHLESIIKDHPGKTVVIVSHSDPLRMSKRIIHDESLEKMYSNGHLPYAHPHVYYFDCNTKKLLDLHKHFMDEITWQSPEGGTMRRVPQVLDCWFESGSMPYAQTHYPFENKATFEANFPANFIAEGVDQTRGWFYTLIVLSAALFDKPAFQNVIVNGTVLAEDGKKMSKRLKNYPAPELIFEKYGADAMRYYLMNSQAVRAGDTRFSEKGVEEVVRKLLLPLWNSYSFFVTYANIDKWEPGKGDDKRGNKLDVWILTRLNRLIKEVDAAMMNYNLQKGAEPIIQFTDDLTNWYIRRSRRRFWKSENDTDKNEAYSTLYHVLITLTKIMAPFTPYIAEGIYQNLINKKHVDALEEADADTSVHLCDWPEVDERFDDEKVEQEIESIKNVVTLGHALRAKKKVKVRQPLANVQIGLPESIPQSMLEAEEDVIKEELNVKNVEYVSDAKEIASVVAMPNARLLGPKYGKEVQNIIKAAKSGDFQKLESGNIKVLDYELLPEEFEIGYQGKEGYEVESADGIVVSLDLTITDELKSEGVARDLVRIIQDMRKEADYHVSDRIEVAIKGAEAIVKDFGDYISNETLAENIGADIASPDLEKEIDIDGDQIKLQIKKS